jgi:hypothetical protein
MCETSQSLKLPQETRLLALVQETCACPQGSSTRQRCLDRLIRELLTSGQLWRRGNIPESDFQDLLQKSWIYFCQNLCEATTAHKPYDSAQASLATWFNAYLKKRMLDYWLTQQPPSEPDYWEPMAAPEPPPILEEVLAWLQKERRALVRVHVRDHPEINCEVLIRRRLPPATAYRQLAQELQVPEATLQGFYQRECLPRLRQAGKDLGYLDAV